MGDEVDGDFDDDPRIERARHVLAGFSARGRKAKIRSMKKRALRLMGIGGLMSIIGSSLVLFASRQIPTSLSIPLAFIGIFMLGFGLVFFLGAK